MPKLSAPVLKKINQVFQLLLRPPGEGLPVFSTGRSSHIQLQKKIYSLYGLKGETLSNWVKTIDWALSGKAKVVILGIPTDTGAGIRRGAAYGPISVREELLKIKEFQEFSKDKSVLDLGDIYSNPHLLYDEMLNDRQKKLCRQAMYFERQKELGFEDLNLSELPVSPLSQLELVLALLLDSNPALKFFVIGGDHSCAWPVAKILAHAFPEKLGIVQSDAHTDLLASRLGVEYCFGSWSYHANELLRANGVEGKMVQLGIRQTKKTKKHWENTTGVKQFWANEIRKIEGSKAEEKFLNQLVKHLKSKGVEKIYFSNDIDGTTMQEAPATGTPAEKGISSRFLLKVIERLGSHFDLVGADIMEVAPDLARNEMERIQTNRLAAKYTVASIRQQLLN